MYFFNSFFLRGTISKIVALEAVLMCPGRPTYSILFSNYPVKDLLMAFMYFEYVPQSFSFSCICSYVCIHMSKSKRYAFVKSVRPACKLWQGSVLLMHVAPGRCCLSCPSAGPSMVSLCSEDQRHSWVCKASRDPAWTLCCLLDTVLAYPSLPFPVCFFLFEMLFFAWFMP